MLGKIGEESGTTAVMGAQEKSRGSRYCGTIGNPLANQINAFPAASRLTRQVIFRSKVSAINPKAMRLGHENRTKILRLR